MVQLYKLSPDLVLQQCSTTLDKINTHWDHSSVELKQQLIDEYRSVAGTPTSPLSICRLQSIRFKFHQNY